MKTKLKHVLIEIRYHWRVMGYLSFFQRISYLLKQVIQRECVKRDFCLSYASLKRLDTNYPDEISNYAFHCIRCHAESQRALTKFFEEQPEENQPQEVAVINDIQEVSGPINEEETEIIGRVTETKKPSRASKRNKKQRKEKLAPSRVVEIKKTETVAKEEEKPSVNVGLLDKKVGKTKVPREASGRIARRVPKSE